MIEHTNFDVLIIGAGQAGIPFAHALAKAGKRIGLAEREHLGGSCVNFGCIPTKGCDFISADGPSGAPRRSIPLCSTN